jgi:hypothetical protein
LRKALIRASPLFPPEVEELGGRGVAQYIGLAHCCGGLGISDTFREPVSPDQDIFDGLQGGECYLPLTKLEPPLCSPRLTRRRRVGPWTKAGIRGVDVVTNVRQRLPLLSELLRVTRDSYAQTSGTSH